MESARKYFDQREHANQKLSAFARRLLSEWKRLRLPVTKQQVIVAVSGGADSTALLLALDELIQANRISLDIIVAHLNHGLRGEDGKQDARWVRELAHGMLHETVLDHVNVRDYAQDSGDNLEQAARRARYDFLLNLAGRYEAESVLTGHTMDDQAETVLLRLMRGSGVEGLGGIKPVRALDDDKKILLVRPLLRWARRTETEGYCRTRGIEFRTDVMNDDTHFARVRVRKQLIPLMQTFNGRVVEALSRTGGLLQQDAMALQSQADELLQEAAVESDNQPMALRIDVLANATASVRKRALRQWLTRVRGDVRRLELVHLAAVDRLVFGERGGRKAELPGGSCVERNRGQLIFHSDNIRLNDA